MDKDYAIVEDLSETHYKVLGFARTAASADKKLKQIVKRATNTTKKYVRFGAVWMNIGDEVKKCR